MTTSELGPSPPDDFTAAKEVFEKLKDLSRDRQQRVLRWVAEGLGVTPSTTSLLVPTERNASNAPNDTSDEPVLPTLHSHKDIRSFVADKNPTSDMQFAATVAYWYHFEAPPAQQRNTIDSRLLQDAARQSGRKRPPHPRQTLNNAKNQGYLDSVSRGEFAINSVGENLVAMTLGRENKDFTSQGPASRRRRASKKGGTVRKRRKQ